jgi:hypothetical protein
MGLPEVSAQPGVLTAFKPAGAADETAHPDHEPWG